MAENESGKFYTKVTHKITITTKEVKGVCVAGFKPGHKITVKVPRVILDETDTVCVNAMSSIMPYIRQFSTEPLPPNARNFVACSDPGPGRGGHGNVLFEITHTRIDGPTE